MTDIQTARHDRLKGAKALERVILDPGDFQWMLDTVQTYRDHLCPAQTPQQVLSGAELELCADLGQCYHEFTILPAGHPSDVAEFASHIHALQNLVMARLAARVHPEDFPNYSVVDGQLSVYPTCAHCRQPIWLDEDGHGSHWEHGTSSRASLGRACSGRPTVAFLKPQTSTGTCVYCGVAIHKVAGDWIHSASLGRACRPSEGKEQTFAAGQFS